MSSGTKSCQGVMGGAYRRALEQQTLHQTDAMRRQPDSRTGLRSGIAFVSLRWSWRQWQPPALCDGGDVRLAVAVSRGAPDDLAALRVGGGPNKRQRSQRERAA